jgi:hypothetical protein
VELAKKINRPQIQNLFRLAFIATQTNVVLIGSSARPICQSLSATPPA